MNDQFTQQNFLKTTFIKTFASVILLAGITLTAQAASFPEQTFVSVNGADSGDCSAVNSPCRTVQYAIEQTFSSSIVTIIQSGVYDPFTIKTSVTVEATAGVSATILTLAGPAVLIDIDPNSFQFGEVTLRGLSFKSRGGIVGVQAASVKNLMVENCTFYAFPLQSLLYEAGASTPTGLNTIFVTDSRFLSGSAGLEIGTTNNALFRKAVIENCQFKGAGMTIKGNTKASVNNSMSNGAVGFRAFGNAGFVTEMNIEKCVASASSSGVATFGVGALIRLSNSTVTNTQVGIQGNVISRGNNTVEGNTNNGNFAGTYLAK